MSWHCLNEGVNEAEGSSSLQEKGALPSPREQSKMSGPRSADATLVPAWALSGCRAGLLTLAWLLWGWATNKVGGDLTSDPEYSLWERLEGFSPPLSFPGSLKEERELTPRHSCQQQLLPQSRLWLKIQRKASVDQRCFPLRARLLWIPETEYSASGQTHSSWK